MERPFNPIVIFTVLPKLIAYLPVTLVLTIATVTIGLLLGFLLARAKMSKSSLPRNLASAYVTAMRCTPSIVLLFLVYYGLPALIKIIFGIDINGMNKAVFVVIALSMLFAANLCELLRAAYLSVDKGQREAALSAGLSEAQAFFRITAPQAAVAALPNLCNALTSLLKEGALAYTIGMIDMMGQGMLIINRNYGAYGLEVYIALALVYWVLTLVIERSFKALEKYLARGKRRLG